MESIIADRTFLLFPLPLLLALLAAGPAALVAAAEPPPAAVIPDLIVLADDPGAVGLRLAADPRCCRAVVAARDRARLLHQLDRHRQVVIALAGGRHHLDATLQLGAVDSYSTWLPLGDGEPVLDLAWPLPPWQVDAQGLWHVQLPARLLPASARLPVLLVVDGHAVGRNRQPASGTEHLESTPGQAMAGGYQASADSMTLRPGVFHADWAAGHGLELIASHFWVDSHLTVRSYDAASRTLHFLQHSGVRFSDDQRPAPGTYWLENVPGTPAPGRWNLDQATGILAYQPLPGQDPLRCPGSLGVDDLALVISGRPPPGPAVEHITVEGIAFQGADARLPPEGAGEQQASCNLPAAVRIIAARQVQLRACRIHACAGYAIGIGAGCRDCSVIGCSCLDLGGGGIHADGGAAGSPPEARTERLRICDNEVGDYGRLYHSACGILLQHVAASQVLHNSIHDGDYTGISAGWVWGYGPSVCRDLEIADNRIERIGRGVLSDLGGIYTLGCQPGTSIRHNRIADITGRTYGGWGIYLDEGSAEVCVSGNLVERTSDGGFHQHYGKDNRILGNIFAFGRQAQITRTREEDHLSFDFSRNIVLWQGGDALAGHWTNGNWSGGSNCWWCLSGPVHLAGRDLASWQALGHERQSVAADPHFLDAAAGDFRVQDPGTLQRLGFELQDWSATGPRPPAQWPQ